jgi:Tfp pilus assembly protein PilX
MLRGVVVLVVLVVLVLVLLVVVGVREVGDVRRRPMTYAAKQAGLAASHQECRRAARKNCATACGGCVA